MQTKSTRDKKNTFRSCHRVVRLGGGVFTFRQIEFWLSAAKAKASNSREYGIKLYILKVPIPKIKQIEENAQVPTFATN